MVNIDLVFPERSVVRPDGGVDDDRCGFHVEFDPAAEPPTSLITVAVAMIRGVDVAELTPLHEAIDAAALDELVENSNSPGSSAIQFRYDEFEITVECRGHLWIRRIDGPW